jgi:threonine/homoserine/homoserine lactone efflux protein
MRRTMGQGWRCGFATAAGIAASDAFYASVAALGLHGISGFIRVHESAFHLVAGIFLGCFGLKILSNAHKAIASKDESARPSLPCAFASAGLMTLANPLALLFFISVFTALAPHSGFNNAGTLVIIGGVFAGSFFWSLGIVAGVSLFRHMISDRKRMVIDRMTGAFMILFGITEIGRYFGCC